MHAVLVLAELEVMKKVTKTISESEIFLILRGKSGDQIINRHDCLQNITNKIK